MFDIGWSELLVIAIVAIVVVGPKDLPRMMRTFGIYAGKLRRAAGDFQRQFEDAMRESELDEMRKALEETQRELKAPLDKPLMLPESKAKTEAPQSAASVPEPANAPAPPAKSKAKPKRAAAKAKPATKVSAAESAKPAPRKRKPKSANGAGKTEA